MVIREAEAGDAERIGLAHSIAANEAYGHYFPSEWMAERNTPAKRAEQWTQTLRDYVSGISGVVPSSAALSDGYCGGLSGQSSECGATTSTGQPQRILLAEDGDRVLGFGIFGAAREDDAPFPHELHRLYVLAQTYGTGLAHRLLTAVHPERTPSYLWVMQANTRAIAFYRKHGFEPDGAVEHLVTIANLPKIRMVRP